MKVLDIIVNVLLLVGGLNWGLIGFFEYNLLGAIFGEATAILRVIYAFVGLSALYDIIGLTFGFRAFQHRWCEVPTTVRH